MKIDEVYEADSVKTMAKEKGSNIGTEIKQE